MPNLYPALSPATARRTATRSRPAAASPTCSPAGPATGAHEVVINAPDSVSSLGELEAEQVETAMSVWRERMRTHAGAAYVHVIVNEGKEAGASLPHTHAQLYALPFVPAAHRPVQYNNYATHGGPFRVVNKDSY